MWLLIYENQPVDAAHHHKSAVIESNGAHAQQGLNNTKGLVKYAVYAYRF